MVTKSEREESDEIWRKERDDYGWKLSPAAWPLRLPVIRWFRFAFHTWRAERFAGQWASVGIGIGGMNQHDRWVLYAIYRGWA